MTRREMLASMFGAILGGMGGAISTRNHFANGGDALEAQSVGQTAHPLCIEHPITWLEEPPQGVCSTWAPGGVCIPRISAFEPDDAFTYLGSE